MLFFIKCPAHDSGKEKVCPHINSAQKKNKNKNRTHWKPNSFDLKEEKFVNTDWKNGEETEKKEREEVQVSPGQWQVDTGLAVKESYDSKKASSAHPRTEQELDLRGWKFSLLVTFRKWLD